MDLVTVAVLSMFAAAAAGGVLGFLIARISRFELGLAVGLLLFGAVALSFAARCFLEYRDFAHAGANAVWGEVIAIEDRPASASGSVTSPVPVVRFTAPDNAIHVVRGPSGSSAVVGSHVNVVYDPADPQRSRVGQVSELRGGAIAMLLFGTFPLSFAIWLLFATAMTDREELAARGGRFRGQRARVERAIRRAEMRTAQTQGRASKVVLAAFGGAMACAILWIGLAPGELLQNFVQGFAAIAIVCAGYAGWGIASGGAGAAWSAGMLVMAVNFGVWAYALDLLR